MNALCNIKHEVRSPNTNKARGKAEYFISIEATLSALFCVKHEQGNASTILKNFQRNALIKMCLLVHCNLNGASLFIFVSYNYARPYTSRCFLIAKLSSY